MSAQISVYGIINPKAIQCYFYMILYPVLSSFRASKTLFSRFCVTTRKFSHIDLIYDNNKPSTIHNVK